MTDFSTLNEHDSRRYADKLETRLDEITADNDRLRQQLAEVTRERDRLREACETMSRQLRTAGTVLYRDPMWFTPDAWKSALSQPERTQP